MHKEAWDWVEGVKAKFPDSFKGKAVLEVGSRYINGTVRTLFEGCSYTGLDLSAGPCVDVVKHVRDYALQLHSTGLPFAENLYDTVISCEALEHDRLWRDSLAHMWQMNKKGGLLILTAGGTGRPEHGTTATSPGDSPATNDYYGNITEELFWQVFNPSYWKEYRIEDKEGDFRFWGVK